MLHYHDTMLQIDFLTNNLASILSKEQDPLIKTRINEGLLHDYRIMCKDDMDKLRGQRYIEIEHICEIEPAGCFILKDVLEQDNIMAITGLALMEALLCVYAWWSLSIDDMVSGFMDAFSRESEDEKGNIVEHPAHRWQDRLGTIGLYHMGGEVDIQDVVACEKEWKAAESTAVSRFWSAINNIDYKAIAQLLAHPSDIDKDLSLWMRGILWLIKHKFELDDYICELDEECFEMTPPSSFAIYWDSDDYLGVVDETYNSYNPGSGLRPLSVSTLLFENAIIKPAKTKHFDKMKVFSLLYYFQPTKQQFEYNAQSQFDFRAYLGALDIQQWEAILHRAIKSYKQRMAKRMDANKRTVHT